MVSPERVFQAIEQSRLNLSQQRGYDVHPESHACDFITEGALHILGSQVTAQNLSFELPDATTHHVIHIIDETPQIYDGQFKQFIPPELREELPDILVIDATQSREKIQSMLESIGMQSSTAKAYSHAITQKT